MVKKLISAGAIAAILAVAAPAFAWGGAFSSASAASSASSGVSIGGNFMSSRGFYFSPAPMQPMSYGISITNNPTFNPIFTQNNNQQVWVTQNQQQQQNQTMPQQPMQTCYYVCN